MKLRICRVVFVVAVLVTSLFTLSISASAGNEIPFNIQVTSEIRMDAAIASVWPGGEARYSWWTDGRCDAIVYGVEYKNITVATLIEKVYSFYEPFVKKQYETCEVGFKTQPDLWEVGDSATDTLVVSANEGKTVLFEVPVNVKLYPANSFVKTATDVSITTDLVIDEMSGFYDQSTKKRTFEIYTAEFDAKVGDTVYTGVSIDEFCRKLSDHYPKVQYRLSNLAENSGRALKKVGDRLRYHLLIYNEDTVVLSTYVYTTVVETQVESVKAEPLTYVAQPDPWVNVRITIQYKDGTSKTYFCSDEIWLERYTLDLDQSSFPTEVGEYTMYATVMGTYKVPIQVSVILFPITVSEIVMDEAYGEQQYDAATDTYWTYYPWETYGTFSVTIGNSTYSNLTLWSSDMKLALGKHGFDYGAMSYFEQSSTNLWKIGETFPVEITFMTDVGWMKVNTTAVLKETDAPVVQDDTATVSDKILETDAGGNVTIDLSQAEQGEETPVKNVVLTAPAIEKLAQAETAVEIALPEASVAFNQEAIKTINEKSAGESVKLVVETVEKNTLTQAQQEALDTEDVYTCVTLELQSNGTPISHFGDGVATVTIPFVVPEGKDGDAFRVYYLADDGTKTPMPTSYADGQLSFETSHFSTYIVMELAKSQTGSQTVLSNPVVAGAAVGMVVMVVLGVALVVRRKRLAA